MIHENSGDMFAMLKYRFPHLEIHTLNPEASFSENLHALVSQIMMPREFQSSREILDMKEVVDSQQLKIQKNLINSSEEQEFVYRRCARRQRVESTAEYSLEQSQWNHREISIPGDIMGDEMSQIWQLDENAKNHDWFIQ